MPVGLLDLGHPSIKFLEVHGVIKRVHTLLMGHRRELLANIASHPSRRRGSHDQLGMLIFELAKFAH